MEIDRWAIRGTALFLVILVVGGALLTVYQLWRANHRVRDAFEGRYRTVPSRVYARPPELYPGRAGTPNQLIHKLRDRNYVPVERPTQPGHFAVEGPAVTVFLRSFRYLDGPSPPRKITVRYRSGRVRDIRRRFPDTPDTRVNVVRLEPLTIGSFYSPKYEDWIPYELDEVPDLLVRTLLLVEDRRFYDHVGLDFTGILRAALANLRAGRIVQGGSTLTQQFVKNRFLDNRQTFWRKYREALMALLVEFHHSKDRILEGYLNEVYMGQLGRASIHGFGKASRYYTGTPLSDLEPAGVALLIGLIKGPSQYNPRRHPDAALRRRNHILDLMHEHDLIDDPAHQRARAQSLRQPAVRSMSLSRFPDFVDLVRRRLLRDFSEHDLESRGLRIHTTLIPRTQLQLERTVERGLDEVASRSGTRADSLQVSVVVARSRTGEITGLTGGRRPGYPGFNRVVSARRPIGSLIKPAIYLTALDQPDRYSLITPLEDTPFTYEFEDPTRSDWRPQNYSRTFHGTVPLIEALTHSYNVATARLGLRLGVPEVLGTLERLGVNRPVQPYPAVLLGSVSLTPLTVTQMYQTLANGGFRVPLKVLQGVQTRDGRRLTRSPLRIERTVNRESVYLLNTALERVTREGTGRGLREILPPDRVVAGKTGTTQKNRDSWFAGFSRNRVGVVWVGRDDYRPTGLTGASGALRLWADLARRLPLRSRRDRRPRSVRVVPVDPRTWVPLRSSCESTLKLPFHRDHLPSPRKPCRDERDDSWDLWGGTP